MWAMPRDDLQVLQVLQPAAAEVLTEHCQYAASRPSADRLQGSCSLPRIRYYRTVACPSVMPSHNVACQVQTNWFIVTHNVACQQEALLRISVAARIVHGGKDPQVLA